MERVGVFVVNLLDETDARANEMLQHFCSLEQFHSKIVMGCSDVEAWLGKEPCQIILPVIDAGNISRLSSVINAVRFYKPGVFVIAAILGDFVGLKQELVNTAIDDFVLLPASMEELQARIYRFVHGELCKGINELQQKLIIKFGLNELIGFNPKFWEAIVKVRQSARHEVPILIYGETGTGKELFARAIHYLSPRSSKPFVPINCAAIPTELFENEMFGHFKGAFTGANTRSEGIIQAASGGTLFLDEIDSIPLLMQAKLLRFLEEKEFKPLGSNHIEKADVRIVAAARGDLREKSQQGVFREDLFYRLNVISLFLPPLRDRIDDIPLLAKHFLKKYAGQLGKPVTGFGPGVMELLIRHNWPGNIRELENAVYHAVTVCHLREIQCRDLNLPPTRAAASKTLSQSFKTAKAEAVASFESQFITRLLLDYGGNVSRAARAAGKHRRAFWELMKKYKIEPQKALPN